MRIIKYCIDCKKKLNQNACYCNTKRCQPCFHKFYSGMNGTNCKDGRTLKEYYCCDCGKLLGKYSIYWNGKRCPSCAKKGKLNPAYIDNRTNIKHFCKDCGKLLTDYKAKYCKKCGNKKNSTVKHHVYLKENDDKILKISQSKHTTLHWRAYEYIYAIYGKQGIDEYLKWFDNKYKLQE